MSRVNALTRLVLGLVLVLVASVTLAQSTPTDHDYPEGWQATADRAEKIVDTGAAPDVTLEDLRSEIVDYRETLASARDQNSARIKTLQSQIDALGPKPENIDDEPADIADLRLSLSDQLDALRVPRVVAEEAYNRANGLIGEIDRIIRERQKSKLLSRGPSPLNPALWPLAINVVKTALTGLSREISSAWSTGTTLREIEDEWLALLVIMLVGIILMVMGGRWSERLGNYLRKFGGQGTGVWAFVVSLTRIILPLIGLVVVCTSMIQTGLLGFRGTLLAKAIPEWGATYLLFRWLGDQIYPVQPGLGRVEFRKPYHRAEARILVLLLALTLVFHDAVQLFQEVENTTAASHAVVAFLPIVFSSLILLRLQRIGMQRDKPDAGAPEDAPQSLGLSRLPILLRRAVVFMAIVSPLLAVVGYLNAAEAIVYPAIMTLAAISVLMILHRFFGDLYGWLSGRGDVGKESLLMELVGVGLALISLPFLAIIWGVRVSDLTELWERFLVGTSMGGVQVSPANFLTFLLIFSIGYGATRLVQSGLRTSVLPKTGIDPGGQNAIVSGIGYVGIFLAAVVAITGAGFDLSNLAIVAGALSVGIGFGLQTIVSNFVSGIILLVERPISKGDWIEVGGMMGYVRDISVRSTRIETFDRTDLIVPNSDLISGTVTNFTRGNTIGRVIAPVGVAYGTDTKRVEKILFEIAEAHPMVLANPPPNIVFQGFGADSLDFEIRAILRDVNWVLSVKSDFNHEIARRFAEAGIEIPFAQRDVWLRNPEALPGAAAFTPSARHNFTADVPTDTSRPMDPDMPDE